MKFLRVLGMILTSLATVLPLYFNNLKILIYPDNAQTSVLTTQRKQSIFIRKINRLTRFMEWRTVYLEN
jgi:hypothetical protein